MDGSFKWFSLKAQHESEMKLCARLRAEASAATEEAGALRGQLTAARDDASRAQLASEATERELNAELQAAAAISEQSAAAISVQTAQMASLEQKLRELLGELFVVAQDTAAGILGAEEPEVKGGRRSC